MSDCEAVSLLPSWERSSALNVQAASICQRPENAPGSQARSPQARHQQIHGQGRWATLRGPQPHRTGQTSHHMISPRTHLHSLRKKISCICFLLIYTQIIKTCFPRIFSIHRVLFEASYKSLLCSFLKEEENVFWPRTNSLLEFPCSSASQPH